MQDKKKNKVAKSILATLCYSDIFDYPLNRSQIYKYLIGERVSKKDLNVVLSQLCTAGVVFSKDGLYTLNIKNISTWKRRFKESKSKWEIAKKTSSILSKIPTVKLIGISGSLSMNNAEKKDDIDLFIITSRETLWITRFIVNGLLQLNGIKRNRVDSYGVNLICPNMFVAQDQLLMDKNLFLAHEITQLKVLVNKDNSYEKFLGKNEWVLKYMPNAFVVSDFESRNKGRANLLLSLTNRLFYWAQYKYMKKRMTNEKVSQNRAGFHPKDKTNFVLKLHEERCNNYMRFLVKKSDFQLQIGQFLKQSDTPGY